MRWTATVFAPSGAQVTQFDSNLQQQITLPESGTYVVRIQANNLASTGSYNLHLGCLQPLGPIEGTLNCGDLVSGSIDAAAEADFYTLAGQADDVITLALVEPSNWGISSNDARLTLFAPSGAQATTSLGTKEPA